MDRPCPRPPLRLIFVILLFPLLALAACGEDDDEDAPATPTPAPSVAGPQEQPPPAQPLSAEPLEPAAGVVEMTAEGTLFVRNYLRIPVGEAVVIRITNNDSVQHNLRIAGIDGAYETEDDALTAPEAIDQGGVGELTFAPPVAGVYTFRCDFHPDSMGGQIVAGEGITPGPTRGPTASPGSTTEGEETPGAATP